MEKITTLLKNLISTPGLSAYEEPARQLITASWSPLVDEISVSRLGSVHGLRKGALPEPCPSILLAAHMDAIGFMVSSIREGFLFLTSIGGIDARVLPGQPVMVHGRKTLPGIIIQPPAHLLPIEEHNKPVPLEYLLVDVGLGAKDVSRLVRVGDLISFDQKPIEFSEDILAGHSLDNRASVTSLSHCLELLKSRTLQWDLWVAATVQEEVSFGGGYTSAFQLQPTLAIAVDVTFGRSPGSPGYKTFPIGQGITLGWGPNIHPYLYKKFKDLAEVLEIPFKDEIMPRHSGTDAFSMQVTAEGIPTMVVSIPIRYMHTPVEMVSIKDILRAGRLLAEFIASLDAEFMKNISWDVEQ